MKKKKVKKLILVFALTLMIITSNFYIYANDTKGANEILIQILNNADLSKINYLQGINIKENEYQEIQKFTLELVNNCKNDEEKMNTIFKWVHENVKYGNANNDPYEVFINRVAVCQGYANLYTVMMDILNIPTILIQGNTYFGAHAWCLTNIKDNWILIDPTNYIIRYDVKDYDAAYTNSYFTPTYIHNKRNEVLSNLRNNVEELTVFFVRNPAFKDTEVKSAELIKHYNLPQQFLQKQMERAFCGKSHYAKSFLTSEYLFEHFKNNPMFDYTPIVSGYIKSIEQLLFAICKSYLSSIKRKENMGSWTMGSYQCFIDNSEEILRPELRLDKSIILDCLESYRIESRNHLFHRDYFSDWKRVEQIRNNTIFLYVVLLSMIDDTLISNTPDLLGILDEKYDRLFSIIDKDRSSLYVLEIEGKTYYNMEKEPRYDGIKYTWNGLIRNTIFKGYHISCIYLNGFSRL